MCGKAPPFRGALNNSETTPLIYSPIDTTNERPHSGHHTRVFFQPDHITLILAPLNGFDPRSIACDDDSDIPGWEREATLPAVTKSIRAPARSLH